MAGAKNGRGTLGERMAVVESRLANTEADVAGLEDAIKSLRNAVLTFAFTVAGSAIAVLLALTQLVAK